MIPIDLTGKSALVTGGTRGIGRAITRTLAAAGASTAAIYRSDEKSAAESLVERRTFSPGPHNNYKADVGESDEIVRIWREYVGDYGDKLDILIHNAAAGAGGPIENVSPEQWQRVLSVNMTAAYWLCKTILPSMHSGSSIVNIASGAGHDPMAGLLPYGASKAGLIMFTIDLAQDIGPRGIRANVVSPGGTDTSVNPVERHVEHNALRRQGVAQDVANVVLFLCSDLASFVTGQAIRVNGGAV